MTTGEKITTLRKKKNLTQEQLSEILKVSRQSVSRWEMDIAFPETEKLIKLSRLLGCSIDYLLNGDLQDYKEEKIDPSVHDCFQFIRECGYFFLATSVDNKPRLRPMGMIYSNDKALYIVTDKRKSVYTDLINNPQVEIASYSLHSRKWLRINGEMKMESSEVIKEEITSLYPMIKQEYAGKEEIFMVIFKLEIESISLN